MTTGKNMEWLDLGITLFGKEIKGITSIVYEGKKSEFNEKIKNLVKKIKQAKGQLNFGGNEFKPVSLSLIDEIPLSDDEIKLMGTITYSEWITY